MLGNSTVKEVHTSLRVRLRLNLDWKKFICLLQEWGRALLKGRDGSTQTNEEVKGTLVQHKSSVIIQVTIVQLSHI